MEKDAFHENEKLNELFKWQWTGGDNMVCGVAIGDVNRDGLMDIVLGSHFLSPWYYPQPVRLFLNREINGGLSFEEVTLQAGLPPIHIKTPHVEIRISTTTAGLTYASASQIQGRFNLPDHIQKLGCVRKGVPKFVTDANDVNDFPARRNKFR